MNKKCMRCQSERLVHVNGKTSDLCVVKFLKTNDSFEGKVQSDIGIGGGDYIDFDFCLDCGQIQSVWPKPKTIAESEIEELASAPFKKGDLIEFMIADQLCVGTVKSVQLYAGEVEISVNGTWVQRKDIMRDILKDIIDSKDSITPHELNHRYPSGFLSPRTNNYCTTTEFLLERGSAIVENDKVVLTKSGSRTFSDFDRFYNGFLGRFPVDKRGWPIYNLPLSFDEVKKTDKVW